MTVREFDDLFYVCSLLESVSRSTKNHRGFVAERIGQDGIQHLLNFADINHCLSMEQVTEETIEIYGIPNGDFDPAKNSEFHIPGITQIGKVYARLVESTLQPGETPASGIIRVFSSFISDAISDFRTATYYSSPDYLKQSLLAGELLD